MREREIRQVGRQVACDALSTTKVMLGRYRIQQIASNTVIILSNLHRSLTASLFMLCMEENWAGELGQTTFNGPESGKQKSRIPFSMRSPLNAQRILTYSRRQSTQPLKGLGPPRWEALERGMLICTPEVPHCGVELYVQLQGFPQMWLAEESGSYWMLTSGQPHRATSRRGLQRSQAHLWSSQTSLLDRRSSKCYAGLLSNLN